MPVTTIRTTCKIGVCEPYCGIEVDVADDRIVAVRAEHGSSIGLPRVETPVELRDACVTSLGKRRGRFRRCTERAR